MQFPFQVQNHSKPITADKMPKIQNYSIENPNLRRGGLKMENIYYPTDQNILSNFVLDYRATLMRYNTMSCTFVT